MTIQSPIESPFNSTRVQGKGNSTRENVSYFQRQRDHCGAWFGDKMTDELVSYI
jgi:hypothetical protein